MCAVAWPVARWLCVGSAVDREATDASCMGGPPVRGNIIYHCLSVQLRSNTVLSSVSAPAHGLPPLAWEHDTRSNTLRRPSRRLICADGPHAIGGPRFPQYLCLSSGAELTPAAVNPGMPSAHTHRERQFAISCATAAAAILCRHD